MPGYNDYMELKRLEELASELGFKLGPSKWDTGEIALIATSDLAIYAEDVALASGDSATLRNWLNGWENAIRWLTLLKVTDKNKIQKKIQDHKNQEVMDRLRREEKTSKSK